MTFNDACERLSEQTDLITTYESLKDFAIHMIQEDHLYLALHILEKRPTAFIHGLGGITSLPSQMPRKIIKKD